MLNAGRSLWGYFTTKENQRGSAKNSPRSQGPELTTAAVAFDCAITAGKTAAQVTSTLANKTLKYNEESSEDSERTPDIESSNQMRDHHL